MPTRRHVLALPLLLLALGACTGSPTGPDVAAPRLTTIQDRTAVTSTTNSAPADPCEDETERGPGMYGGGFITMPNCPTL